MGRNTIARFLLTAAAFYVPLEARAQMTFTEEEAQQPAQPAQGTQTGTTPEASGETGTSTGTGGSLQLDVPGGEVTAQRHPFREEIYAVQQIYALRNRRLELSPTANFSLNDPYVQHTGFGLTANYWISNVLAVGVTGVYFPFNTVSDVNLFVGRSTGLVVPINEYQLAAAVNFSYVPLYGKFSMFSRYIFHWDLYLTAGVGVMRSRPIPAIDPEVRTFDWNTAILFNANIGVRIFFTRSVGLTLELRNFVYPELLENTSIGGEGNCSTCRRNRSTWTDQTRLTDNVMVSLGLTVFLPFSFNYRLPK